jgi:hypothetical protein
MARPRALQLPNTRNSDRYRVGSGLWATVHKSEAAFQTISSDWWAVVHMVRCTTGGKNGVKVVLCFSKFDAMKCWDEQRHVPNDQNQKKIFQN